VRDLLARLVRWRVGLLWYAAALALMAALSYLTLAIGAVIQPDSPARIGQDASLSAAVLYFFTNLPNMWLTEETAWRGFVLPRLQLNDNALTASLIVGALWGLWHIPLFLTPGSFQAQMPFAGFLISALATSVLTTWIFNHARGSVLVAAIFHSATDAAILYTGVMASGPGLFWTFVIVLCLAALVVTVVEGPARLMRRQEMDGTRYPTATDAMLGMNDAR
jgi:uncharacterized protein